MPRRESPAIPAARVASFGRHAFAVSVLLIGALLIPGCSGSGGKVSARHASSSSAPKVHLTPDPAYAQSRIDVVFEDPWFDASACRFEWRRDGSLVHEARGASLDPAYVTKGQQITVAVFPPNDATPGRAEVQVQNSPPTVTNVTLVMTTSAGPPQVEANVQSVDPDRDALTYEFTWHRNGTKIEGASGARLAVNGLGRGDRVETHVIANDGQAVSAEFRSQPFSLDNRPPAFSSKPVAPRPSDEAFRYNAAAVDPDGDPLRYELLEGPAGMLVDPSGGVSWLLPPAGQRSGSYRVRLKVTDAKGGEAVQEFAVDLNAR